MKCDTDWERERCQTQMAFSCVALVIPDKYNISPFRFTVNLLCQSFEIHALLKVSLMCWLHVCVSRIYVWFALASGSAHWFHSLIYLNKKNSPEMESHNSYLSSRSSLAFLFCQSLYLSCVGLLMSFASCSFLFQWWNYFIFFSLLICLCMQLLGSNTNGLVWLVDVCKRGQEQFCSSWFNKQCTVKL